MLVSVHVFKEREVSLFRSVKDQAGWFWCDGWVTSGDERLQCSISTTILDLDSDTLGSIFFENSCEHVPQHFAIFFDDSAMCFGDSVVWSISDCKAFGVGTSGGKTCAWMKVFIIAFHMDGGDFMPFAEGTCSLATAFCDRGAKVLFGGWA